MAITIRPTPHLKNEQAIQFLEKVKAEQSHKIEFSAQKKKAIRILEKAKKSQKD